MAEISEERLSEIVEAAAKRALLDVLFGNPEADGLQQSQGIVDGKDLDNGSRKRLGELIGGTASNVARTLSKLKGGKQVPKSPNPPEPPSANTLTISQIRRGIGVRESGKVDLATGVVISDGDYRAVNFNGDSTGMYQFKRAMWHAWARLLKDPEADFYPEPRDAPPLVQDRMAQNALAQLTTNPLIGNDRERLIAVWLTGEGPEGEPSLAEGPKSAWTQVPDGDNPHNPTVRDYVDFVVKQARRFPVR